MIINYVEYEINVELYRLCSEAVYWKKINYHTVINHVRDKTD